MKNLLYIGNNLSKTGKTETTIDTLSKNLSLEGYTVYTSSNKKNKMKNAECRITNLEIRIKRIENRE
jgi:hypothetical protein